MKTLYRIKAEGMEILEIDVNTIEGYRVVFDDLFNEYILTGIVKNEDVLLTTGTFDKCHTMLNKLHKISGIQIVDL